MAKHKKRNLRRNSSLSLLLLLIPLAVGVAAILLIFTGVYQDDLGKLGSKRLETQNWQQAEKVLVDKMPQYERKFAYYKLKERQDINIVSEHFGVPTAKLAALNPGTLISGTTIKVTPVESPLKPIAQTNGKLAQARVIEEGTLIRVKQDFKNERVITNLAELSNFLAPYKVFEKFGEKNYRLLRPLAIEDNIRIDITNTTVAKLELRSSPNDITCLCVENIDLLIKGVEITSYDPTKKGPDTNPNDQRSFIRALKSSRMDIIDSKITYLGNSLSSAATSNVAIQKEGGTYGISWRIPDDMLGVDIVTGWVENTTFHKNHFGSYTFGASGMVWKSNTFSENDVYGLDPHDDSNNALVEDNVFANNGKHGFIVSKRCNYNVIRNNVSYGNKLHGYMLHQDSVYNIIENNVAYDNFDNFAIYASNFNTIKSNKSFNPRGSHIRINEQSVNTYITNNTIAGGKKAVYLYGDAKNVYITNNTIQSVSDVLATNNAKNVFFGHNTISSLGYKFLPNDRVVFGPNEVSERSVQLPPGVHSIKQAGLKETK